MDETQTLNEKMISNVGERAVKASKGDIVQQIKDLYMRKGHRPDGESNRVPLVPTRAALFGLDVRFRYVDEKLNQKKLKRSALNQDDPNETWQENRHSYPSENLIKNQTKTERKRAKFQVGSCYDNAVTQKLNERLPENVAYLNYKDLQPKVKLTQEQIEERKNKFQQSLSQSTNDTYLEQAHQLTLKKQSEKQRTKLCEKPKDVPPPEHDRETVRRGQIFATQEELNYVRQLIDLTQEYKEQNQLESLEIKPQFRSAKQQRKETTNNDQNQLNYSEVQNRSQMFNVHSIVKEINAAWSSEKNTQSLPQMVAISDYGLPSVFQRQLRDDSISEHFDINQQEAQQPTKPKESEKNFKTVNQPAPVSINTISIKEKKGKPQTAQAHCSMKNPAQTKWTLAFNKNAYSTSFTDSTKLQSDVDPKQKMQSLQQKLEENVNKVFDSNKNWSIMIKDDLNDVRNEIMRRTKSNQIKRRFTGRPQLPVSGAHVQPNPTTLVQSKKDLNPEQDQIQWKENFTEYIKNLVTKSNASTVPSTRQQSKGLRKSLLKKIQRNIASDEGEDDFKESKVSIKDIAEYIRKDLRAGWHTGAQPTIPE